MVLFNIRAQKKALANHINITHLGRRDHVCPHESCKQAYGYKHLLQRHLAKVHTSAASDAGISTGSSSEDDDPTAVSSGRLNFKSKPPGSLDIDTLTGQSYAKRTRDNVADSKTLRCPYPKVNRLTDMSADEQEIPISPPCQYAFSRAYDLRRHLKAAHNIHSTKERVDMWVRDRKKAPHT